MVDVFDKCNTDGGYFGPLRAQGDHYFTRPVLPPKADRIMKVQNRDCIMWSLNNYLGLANNPEIKKSAMDALEEYSVSSPMGSRMMSGNSPYHLELENILAEYSQKEAAFLFNYGYLGVLGTVSALAGPDDIIIMDKLAHACIVDSAFLSKATVRVFKHNDPNSLEITLKRVNRDRKGGVLILTEGVYGMTGDLVDLPSICELKNTYEARLFIDDAHGWGVMGNEGRGTGDHYDLQDQVDIYFGTFAKSYASIGGFSASTKAVIEWIMYNARTQVFAKSLPMVYVQSLKKSIDFVRYGDERRARMRENSNALKKGLNELGYFIGPGGSPICAVFAPIGKGGPTSDTGTGPTGNSPAEKTGMRLVHFLRERGIFVTAITYPVIPLGLMMFRMIPTAIHTMEDIEKTVEAFREMRDEMGVSLEMDKDNKRQIAKVYGPGANIG